MQDNTHKSLGLQQLTLVTFVIQVINLPGIFNHMSTQCFASRFTPFVRLKANSCCPWAFCKICFSWEKDKWFMLHHSVFFLLRTHVTRCRPTQVSKEILWIDINTTPIIKLYSPKSSHEDYNYPFCPQSGIVAAKTSFTCITNFPLYHLWGTTSYNFDWRTPPNA